MKLVSEAFLTGLICYFVFKILQASQVIFNLSEVLQALVYIGSFVIVGSIFSLFFNILEKRTKHDKKN
jgi:hypothetical protein